MLKLIRYEAGKNIDIESIRFTATIAKKGFNNTTESIVAVSGTYNTRSEIVHLSSNARELIESLNIDEVEAVELLENFNINSLYTSI